MNIVTPELAERLAAEYVLGTLTGGARRRFDALLPAHPALRRAVAAWEQRLLPMALRSEPVQPAPRVWTGIEAQLGWRAAARPAPWRLRFWQALATFATVAAVVLGTVPRHGPVAAPMIVVLHATKGSETIVAGLSPDRRQLSIQPLQKVALTSDQSLELWALKKDGPPASLGVIAADKLTAIHPKSLPGDTKGLAVSLEPLGGSPTGAPTGPVLFVGELTL
ncbi:MAG: anti-sigma factor [Burkholderiales bacterium]|nr:anti-sigma factor [Burkholderiales bacterium]